MLLKNGVINYVQNNKTGFLSNEALDEDRISLNIPKTFHGKVL